ncbi:hypothetical protein GCK72_004410 [Caenorhabditis remanei]|uniref:Uncharacterized protein n=1 Tax=Caenorhabditis remanei TaxID=31234 RepID=A0A6A5HDR7_CAERE|nr:hypothetical protein GCK72_004410 [Caenorhabditis remanei]KAF1764462.1 hypothetical protein GCK72_004410 [Caenorhabditis remanei]
MSAEYPSEKCLITMPDVVMNKLLGLLDFPAVQCLRKTCPTLRNFIDDVKPNSALIILEIKVEPNCITSLYYLEDFVEIKENLIRIKYCKTPEGCSVEWDKRDNRQQKKLLESDDFVDAASKDIISVLANQKSVMESLNVEAVSPPDDILEEHKEILHKVFEQFLSNLESYLASEPKSLNVKTFETNVGDETQILHILPHIDVGDLTIWNPNRYKVEVLNIQELIKLEQWKKLDSLHISCFCVDLKIEDLLHLKWCDLQYETVSSDMIEELKEAFRTTSHLESFRIFGQSDIQQLMDPRYAGPHIENRLYNVTNSWFFSVSAPERVLKVSFSSSQVLFEFDLLVNVPEGATIN